MTSAIQREFLGWDRPLLETAEEWLFRNEGTAAEWDLGNVIVVVPGRRAGRRLLERLVLRAESARRRLIPPLIETLGVLPEQLYPLQRPLANDLTQQLTWTHTLRQIDRGVLERIAPRPPADDDAMAWWRLAKLIQEQHRELAADGLDFTDVAQRGQETPGFSESSRWAAMSEIQREFLRTLDGLGLWDVQTARLVAVKKREPRSDREIVLIGTVDINRVTRRILDLVVENSPSCQITALIAAPPERSNDFDAHGCLLPTAWNNTHVDLPESDLRVCSGAAEQSEQVSRELAVFGERYRADEIVVGLADEKLGPLIVRDLESHAVPTRWIEGIPLANAGPTQLLIALADVLETDRYEELAALVRHADIGYWLRSRVGESLDLSALDAAFCEHLPLGLDELESLLRRHSEEPLRAALRAMRDLLRPWQGAARRIHEWGEPLLAWLRTIFDGRVMEASTAEGRSWPLALTRLNEAIRELAAVPPSVSPIVNAAEAIRCVVQRLAEQYVPPEADSNSIELLGWLDLWLDDTPAAIVTTFNESFVPTSLNSDLFLPNELRRRLGLNDNSRRFARDAYAVTVLRHSRRDVRWLVARRDPAGKPLVPSRLLFATDAEELPGRVLRTFGEPSDAEAGKGAVGKTFAASECETTMFAGSDTVTGSNVERLRAPTAKQIAELLGAPELLQPTRELTLNVTEFRTYLSCPFRYFLKHVARLRSLDDDAVEMDGLAFGNILHEVLRQFGLSAHKNSSDPVKLRKYLRRTLDTVAESQFGSRRRVAVSVQLMQLESRLDAFAAWQTKWRNQGWVIEHVERAIRPDDQVIDAAMGLRTQPTLSVVDETGGEESRVAVWLHGRIDRLDRNEQTGDWALFDYKSGDRGDEPGRTHRKKSGEWIDLQLPLYRHLVRELSLPREPKLGYINLPKDLNEVGARFADWTAADLAAADATAADVVRQIAARHYEPADKPPHFIREFDTLCYVGVFGNR